ncbi:MAG TPA: pitrilysin family protein [Solirubrobacteraceae bacterium]|nr:pitrilysin family protein [Solirubrobacteraceae bacterium]
MTTLPSGVRVVSERLPGVRSVALGYWIANGSAAERDEQAGLSHLVEHMLFRGTDRFASVEIDQIFDAMGAEVNAGTDKETTSLFSRVLDHHVEHAFDVMSDMVWRPTFGGLDAEREVVLEEIAMYEDDPQELVFDVLGEAIFGAHPLGRPIIGRAAVVGAVTREELLAFHGARYRPERVVVAAAGSIDHEELVALVERHGPSVEGAPAAPVGGDRNGIPQEERRVRFVRKDTEQYHVCLGGPGIPRDDERRFALRVLDNILGGTSSSRLFQEVREERGLAYAIYSFTSHFARAGEIGLYLGTRGENLGEALGVIAGQLERVREDPASVAELDRSRENLKGRMALALESTQARMNRLGTSVLADLPILSVDEIIERIDAVGHEDLLALAGELLDPARLSVAGIGPDEELLRAALAPVGGGA